MTRCRLDVDPEGWHVVAGIGERAPALPATVLYEPEGAE